MDNAPQRLSHSFWIGVGFLIVILCLAYTVSERESRRGPVPALPVLGPVSDFALTNQTGAPATLADLRGRVWVADIIFTRCAGPCPIMTRQMKSLQDALPRASRVKLVTLTTDPDYDTPSLLRIYAERFGADTNRWLFLTGAKKDIATLAAGSLKLSAVETKPAERQGPEDLFVHSTLFVIVDKQARLRGVFETTGEGIDWPRVQPRILAAARRLERER